MAGFDWKDALKGIAPIAATLLGGPLAGTAVKMLGEVLLPGDPTPTAEKLQAIVQQGLSGDQIVALRQADNQLKSKMIDAGVRLEEIDGADRDSARKRQIALGDPTPNIIALLILGFWGWVQFTVIQDGLPPKLDPQIVIRVLGMLDAAALAVIYYFFGSSRSSAQANATIHKMVQ